MLIREASIRQETSTVDEIGGEPEVRRPRSSKGHRDRVRASFEWALKEHADLLAKLAK